MRSRYEIKAQKELENEGHTVDYKPRSRFAFGLVDFFNRFDLMAIKKAGPLRFISVKGHAGVPGKHRQEIASFYLPKSCTKEIWVYRKGKKEPKKEIIN